MKLITRNTDYAVRALACMAVSKEKIFSVEDFIRHLKAPRPFLRKILQTLTKKGVLQSFRGKGGGFSLAITPDKIVLTDIMEIFQGPFNLNEHVFKGKGCPVTDICVLKKRLDTIEKMVNEELRKISIAELIR